MNKRWFTIGEAAVELGLSMPEVEAAIERWSRHELPGLMTIKRDGQRMAHQTSLDAYRAQLKLLSLTPEERKARVDAMVAAMPEPILYQTSDEFYAERIEPALRKLGMASIDEFTRSPAWDTYPHSRLTMDICFYWATQSDTEDSFEDAFARPFDFSRSVPNPYADRSTIRTRSGRVVSDEDLDEMVKQAERGFDLSTWQRRKKTDQPE